MNPQEIDRLRLVPAEPQMNPPEAPMPEAEPHTNPEAESSSQGQRKKRVRPQQAWASLRPLFVDWLCERICAATPSELELITTTEEGWLDFHTVIMRDAERAFGPRMIPLEPEKRATERYAWLEGNVARTAGNMIDAVATSSNLCLREELKDKAVEWNKAWTNKKLRKEAHQPPHLVKKVLAQTVRAKRPGETDKEWERRKRADAKTTWFAMVDCLQLTNRALIGEGAFGYVYRCNIMGSSFIKDEPYCVKFQHDNVRLGTAEPELVVKAMMKNMRESQMQVRHGAIIRCIGRTTGLERTGLIFPYWNGGSCASLFCRHGDNEFQRHAQQRLGHKPTPEINVQKLEQQRKLELYVAQRVGDLTMSFLSGLLKLHKEQHLHMDLHPGNVLLHFDFGKEKGCTDPKAVYIGICDWGEERLIGEPVAVKRCNYNGMDGDGKRKIEKERLAYPYMHDDLFWGPKRDGTRMVPARVDFDLIAAAYFIKYLADFARKHSFLEAMGTTEQSLRFRNMCDYLKHCVESPIREKARKFDLNQLLNSMRSTWNCSPTICTRPQMESDWIPQVGLGADDADQAGPSHA